MGGPAFNWIEINAVGTAIALTGDDQNVAGLPIGFTFPYYGSGFTTFHVCTNGWISFSSTATSYSNTALPAAGAPANMVAPFWDDLTFSASGSAYYYYDGTRLIIEYKKVPHLTAGGPYSLQVQLYPSGVIEYHYLSMPTPVDSATIGFQNATGTDGLTTVFNAAYLHDNLAVRFASVPPWLSTGPSSGSVAAGASVDLTVDFDAAGLCGSHFDANLHVLSNDPMTPDTIVPVGLDLIGTPDIQAAPTSVDFGSVYMTASATLNVTVANAGCADLHVTGLGFDNSDFSTAVAPFTLAASATQAIPVVFAPTSTGPIAGNLTLTSDDPDSPAVIIALAGVGLEFPNIAVAPPSLSADAAHRRNADANADGQQHGSGSVELHRCPSPSTCWPSGPRCRSTSTWSWPRGPRTRGPAGRCRTVRVVRTCSATRGRTATIRADPCSTGSRSAVSERRSPSPGTTRTLRPFPIGFSFPFYGNSLHHVPRLHERLDQLFVHRHGRTATRRCRPPARPRTCWPCSGTT